MTRQTTTLLATTTAPRISSSPATTLFPTLQVTTILPTQIVMTGKAASTTTAPNLSSKPDKTLHISNKKETNFDATNHMVKFE